MVAQEISRELSWRDYDVTVLTSDVGAEGSKSDEIRKNYRVRRLNSINVAHTPIIWSLFVRLLALPRHSVIHLHVAQAGVAEAAVLAAKIRGIPVVAHFHLDVGPSGALGVLLPVYKKYFLGNTLRAANRVVVFSEEQRDLISKQYGIKTENIAIIPNGVSNAFFSGRVRNAPAETFNLLYVGRLDAQKRVERLIEAVSLLTIPVSLTLVGDGEKRRELEELTKRLKLSNVSFEGRKSGDALKAYYRDADVYLTPSDREGMSLVALEAMASGLPVIGSDVIGTRELIQGVGVLVGEPYPQNFAQAITALWEKPERLEELSQKSTAKARQYSWDILIKKFEALYKELSP